MVWGLTFTIAKMMKGGKDTGATYYNDFYRVSARRKKEEGKERRKIEKKI